MHGECVPHTPAVVHSRAQSQMHARMNVYRRLDVHKRTQGHATIHARASERAGKQANKKASQETTEQIICQRPACQRHKPARREVAVVCHAVATLRAVPLRCMRRVGSSHLYNDGL